jgi:hypothetical protein
VAVLFAQVGDVRIGGFERSANRAARA